MPSHPALSPGNTALITGAASGIGLAVAKLFHSKGLNVALADINASALTSAQKAILSSTSNNDGARSPAAMVKTYTLDISTLNDWKDLRAKVEMDFGLIHILMLNAAIAHKSGWEDVDYFRKIMDTNYFGVIHGISTFLPSLRRQAPTIITTQPNPSSTAPTANTAIIITGSKQGITNPPGNPAYNASKAAVKSVAEHLSYDLRNTSTSVHLLVPGWTWTGMTSGGGGGEKPEGAWEPEQVAGFLDEKMGEGRFYIVCPDNDVSEGMDRKRILWTARDLVEGRPPLSRWREGYKEQAERWMGEQPG